MNKSIYVTQWTLVFLPLLPAGAPGIYLAHISSAYYPHANVKFQCLITKHILSLFVISTQSSCHVNLLTSWSHGYKRHEDTQTHVSQAPDETHTRTRVSGRRGTRSHAREFCAAFNHDIFCFVFLSIQCTRRAQQNELKTSHHDPIDLCHPTAQSCCEWTVNSNHVELIIFATPFVHEQNRPNG